MWNWASEHPFLFTLIVLILIFGVDNSIGNLMRGFIVKHNKKKEG